MQSFWKTWLESCSSLKVFDLMNVSSWSKNTGFSCRSKQQVGEVMSAFKGNVRQMLRHSEASSVVEYAYNDKAILSQRLMLTEELYGNTFQVCKVLQLRAASEVQDQCVCCPHSWSQHLLFSVLSLSYVREGFGSKSREVRRHHGWNEADPHTNGSEVSNC